MKWTLLVKIEGGQMFFNRAGWEMLLAQIKATGRPVVQVVGARREQQHALAA